MLWIVLLVVFLLAFANGANDNFKGVATLFGSGTTNYNGAIIWATVTTFLGSISAIFLAGALVEDFSGKGLIPDEYIKDPAFVAAVASAAAITVLIATKIGMPVSTTHSLIGALSGSGIIAAGTAFNFSLLGNTFLMPLLASPVLAGFLSIFAYRLFKKGRMAAGVSKDTCLCIGNEKLVLSPAFWPGKYSFISDNS